ncbi:MAG: energy-coupling factor ABC transporter ATP-binding protein [Oscillospiraceae bacterium]|nr:energy-coupling factor ABC transporter ATP-binding protein [Oscillospiraceae bacterium]
MTAIEVRNLSVSYGDYSVLRDFSLTVDVGEAVLIKGPSGCGKSTLLHAICGLIPSVIDAECAGEVLVFGDPVQSLDVAERAKRLGIVFQNPETQLFCDSIEDEIAFGLENICTPRNEMAQRIDEMLKLTDMETFRFASPKELSGGQKQRAVLAAVMALDPKVLLLDEALSQLDKRGKETLCAQFAKLRREERTMLMVDHDDELVSIASRIITLQ